MAGELNVTVVDASIPEIWIAEALRARYFRAVASKPEVVTFKSDAVGKYGDQLDFTELATLTVNDVSASGTVANQATTHTARTVILNLWKEVTWTIPDRASRQTILDHQKEFAIASGKALAQQMDNQLLGLHGSFTTNVEGSTTTPTPMSDSLLLSALTDLEDSAIPMDELHLILRPKAKQDLLAIDKFVLAYATGLNKGAQLTGQVGELYGVPVLVTNQVAATGTPSVHKNLLIHREAIAMAVQKDINVEQFARSFGTGKATSYSADVLYGVGVIRENHGVVLNTSAV